MDFRELRKYQQNERRSSQLQNLPDTFYGDVENYCKKLEENKEYQTLGNVLSIVSLIKTMRLRKLFDMSLVYIHQGYDLDEVVDITPNITSLEGAVLIKILMALMEYDHVASSECKYLKK